MSDRHYDSTAESTASDSEPEEKKEKLGRWMPQKLKKFEKGTQFWHNFVTDEERQMTTDALTRVVLNPKKSLHHRLPELIWFARQLELFLYNTLDSKEAYISNVKRRVTFLKSLLRSRADWDQIKTSGDIPCTDVLETLYCTKVPRLPYVELVNKEELMAGGGTVVNLITKEQFNEFHCPINVHMVRKTLEPERRKQRVIKNGPGNRKILMARYANREMAESNSMTFKYEEYQP